MSSRPDKVLLENATFESVAWAMKDEPGFIVIDSRGLALARYSIVASNPKHTFSFSGAFVTRDGHTNIDSPSRVFDEFLRSVDDLPSDPYLPFSGGAIGYISFEGIRALKGFEPAKGFSRFPQCYFGIYTSAIVFDHVEGECYSVGGKNNIPLLCKEGVGGGRAFSTDLPLPTLPLQKGREPESSARAQEWIRAEKLKYVCLTKKERAAMPDVHPVNFALDERFGTMNAVISHGAAFARLCSSDTAVYSDGVCVKTTFPSQNKSDADLIKEYRAIFERICVPGSINIKNCGDKTEISGRRLMGLKWSSVPMELIPSIQTSGAPRGAALSFISEHESGHRGFFGGVFGFFDSEKISLRTIEQATTFADGAIETTSQFST